MGGHDLSRREVLELGKLGVGATQSLGLHLERLGERQVSRIFTPEDIKTLELQPTYSDPGAEILENYYPAQVGVERLASLLEIPQSDLVGAQIQWLVEQHHLELGVDLADRTMPAQEMVYIYAPKIGQKIIFARERGEILVRDVHELFADYQGSITPCMGGVVYLDNDGVDEGTQIVMEVGGEFRNFGKMMPQQPTDERPVEVPWRDREVSWQGNGTRYNQQPHNPSHYLQISPSHGLLLITETGPKLRVRPIGNHFYQPVEFDRALRIGSGGRTNIFQFRGLVGSFDSQENRSELEHRVQFALKEGDKEVRMVSELTWDQISRIKGLEVMPLTDLESIGMTGAHVFAREKMQPLGMISTRIDDGDDGESAWYSLDVPWIAIGIREGQLVLVECEEGVNLLREHVREHDTDGGEGAFEL